MVSRVLLTMMLLLPISMRLGPHRAAAQTDTAQTDTTKTAAIPKSKDNFHLFLLAGQSNMAGRGKVEAQDRQAHDRVLTLNQEGKWVPAVDPLHFDKPKIAGVGPGRSFGLKYAEDHPDVTVGLIPCAVGGSPIASWAPGGYHDQTRSHPYDDANRRTRLALESGVLKGILWNQGGSDGKPGLAEQYEGHLIKLIERLRSELDVPDVPFLIGQMGSFPERPWDEHRRAVDAAHRAVASKLDSVGFVSSEGLQHKGDQIHFDSASSRELGRRYYAAYRELAKDAPEPYLIRVSRIWDRAKHNAFTDLVRFKDQWFCVFREGTAHVSPDGALRVITSADGRQWSSAALLTSQDSDLRDAKIAVTPDGRLMLSGAGAMHDSSQFKHQSMTWFSSDGKQWTAAHPVGDRDVWLWRTTWHGDAAYGIGYQTGKTAQRSIRLYKTNDGKQYETVVENLFDQGFPNESSIVFLDDGTGQCLLRRDGGEKTGLLGTAKPPYTDWTWQDLGQRIGGPHMLQLPDGRFVAAVRLYDSGARTSLCWVDTAGGKLTEFLKLPSGGDTSYAGLVWHDDHLWVSYYSGHEAGEHDFTTAIYLAEVAIP